MQPIGFASPLGAAASPFKSKQANTTNICQQMPRNNNNNNNNKLATRKRSSAITMGAPTTRRNASKMHEQEAQGPYCPLVNESILRYCLSCAKGKQTTQTKRTSAVQQLLDEARLAIGAVQRGQAERLFLRALVTDPQYTRTYLLYALQVQRRDPVLARELFRQGLRADPGDAKILQAWGLFESKQGQLARAQRLLRRSVDLEPSHAPVLKWKVLFPVMPEHASTPTACTDGSS